MLTPFSIQLHLVFSIDKILKRVYYISKLRGCQKLQKEINFTIDSDVYEKLTMALRLSGDNEADVLERCVKSYISKTFGAVSEEFSESKTKKVEERDYTKKAIQRIPGWSAKPNQNNHKIIKAYFTAELATGIVMLEAMEKLCGDKTQSDFYVSNFKNNYAQMKLDGPKTYGKVFEDDGEKVWIWSEVEDVLRKYKDAFLG